MRTRRTLMYACAPILSSVDRTVPLYALANSVSRSPRRRKSHNNTGAKDEKHSSSKVLAPMQTTTLARCVAAPGGQGRGPAGCGPGSAGGGLKLPSAPDAERYPANRRAGPDAGAFGQDVVEDSPVGPGPGVLAIGSLVGVVGEVGQTEAVAPGEPDWSLRMTGTRYRAPDYQWSCQWRPYDGRVPRSLAVGCAIQISGHRGESYNWITLYISA